MAGAKVTDLELLRLLNASESDAAPPTSKRVTDPALLAQLNGPAEAPGSREVAAAKAAASAPYVEGGLPDAMSPDEIKASAENTRGALRQAADSYTFGLGPKVGALGASLRGEAPSYDQALSETTGNIARFKEEHPGIAYPAQVAGGIAAASGLAAGGITVAPRIASALGGRMLGRMAGAAGEGAAYGAADATGHAKSVGELPLTAAGGAGEGIVAGAGLFGLGSALGTGYRAIAPYFASGVDGLSSAGSRILGRAVGRTPEVSARLGDLGPQATLADAGPAMQGMAGRIIEGGGETGDRLLRTFRVRNEGARDRMAGAISDNLGPDVRLSDAQGQFGAMQRDAGRLYEPVLGSAPPVDTSAVMRLIGDRLQTAAGAERTALIRARNELMADGANGGGPLTRADALHNVKGALDDLIRYGDPNAGIPAGSLSREQSSLRQVRGALNAALEEQVPGYASANLATRTPARARTALDYGGQVLNTGQGAGIHPEDFAARLTAMPMEQQAATRIGTTADLHWRLGTGGTKAVDRALGERGGFNERKLSTAFGPDETANLYGAAARERTFADTTKAAESAAARGGRTAGIEAIEPTVLPNIESNATGFGTGARAVAGPFRNVANALLGMRSEGVRREIGSVLALQGGPRDRVVDALTTAVRGRFTRGSALRDNLTRQEAIAAVTAALGGDQPLALRGRPAGLLSGQ